MKWEGTTKLLTRSLWLAVAATFLLSPSFAGATTLQDLLNQQAALRQQAADSQKNIQLKQQQASNLQGAIQGIDSSIVSTQQQIQNTQAQITTTNEVLAALASNIQDTTSKLDQLNDKLKTAYANLYELSQTSTIEMLLQTKSIDDLVSQSQYIQALQADLQNNIAQANTLKNDLLNKQNDAQNQKNDLVTLQQNLNQANNSLISQKAQKNYLLTQTQGEQAKYEQLLTSIQNEAAKISSEIYAKRLALGGFVGGSGTGGYPYANSTPDTPDPWGFLTRECTSYASWKFLQNFGVPFLNTRPGSGSAWNWPNLAHDQGYRTSSNPTVGAIVAWPAGPLTSGYGHVAAIEVVYSAHDVIVSEYNWNRFSYDERRIDPNNFGTPTYITR